jgi:hypothetical protein
MSDELNTAKKSIKEVLIDLMAERVMSIGVQDSLMQGVQASLSTACRSEPSCIADEKITKHKYDLANVKLIPSVLPDYIPPLSGEVNHDNVLTNFDYIVIMAYLPKGIHAVRA